MAGASSLSDVSNIIYSSQAAFAASSFSSWFTVKDISIPITWGLSTGSPPEVSEARAGEAQVARRSLRRPRRGRHRRRAAEAREEVRRGEQLRVLVRAAAGGRPQGARQRGRAAQAGGRVAVRSCDTHTHINETRN